ncbi:DUF853 domain-containing protein, partial [Sulfolobus sp. B5]
IFRRRIGLKFNNYMVRNNLFVIDHKDGKVIYGVAMKIVGKIEASTSKIDIDSEFKNFITAIARRESDFRYAVITSINKNKLGSSIIIYNICNKSELEINTQRLLHEINNLQTLASAVTPHIIFKIVQPSDMALPIPLLSTNYPFLTISEIEYESPININVIPSDYDVELGEADYKITKSKVGIRLDDIVRHIGIFGSTGSGKTNTSMVLATQLSSKGVRVLILDWHGEYAEKLRDNFMVYDASHLLRINPLSLIDLNVEDMIDIIGDVLQLTDPQRFLLYTILLALRKSGKFTLEGILEILNSIEDTSYWIRDVKYALLRKIFILFSESASKLFSTEDTSISKFLENFSRSTIINLSFLTNVKLRKLYALFLVKMITEVYIRAKPKQKMFIILDEAQNYFNKDGNEFIDRLVSEIRKYNIGLCFVTQSPSLISQNVIKNTNIKIIHTIKSDVDKRVIKDSLSLDDRLSQSLDKLDVGEAILSAPSLKIPIIVKIKKIY